MSPEQILEIIEDYAKNDNTDYALMINGKWGSGKTFFWKECIRKRIMELGLVEREIFSKKVEVPKVIPLYVSLYGITNVNNLDRQILSAFYPIIESSIGSKTGKKALSIGKTILSVANSYFKTDDIGLKINEIFANLKGFLICFDDLERLNKDLIFDVLGHINNLVEHNSVKVLLLANEQEIFRKDEKPKEEYLKIKEKLIRNTFLYKPNIKEALKGILNRYEENSSYQNYIKSKMDFIDDIFNELKCENLRTLTFCLDIFEDICECIVKNETENSQEILDMILFNVFVVGYEYKHGKLQNHNIEEFKKASRENKFWFISISPEKYQKPTNEIGIFILDIYNKHIRNSDAYRYIESLVDFVTTGYFNKDTFNVEIEKLLEIELNPVKKEAEEIFQTLKDISELEDNQLDDIVNKAIDFIKTGNLEPTKLISAYYYLYKITQQYEITSFNIEDNFEDFILGLNKHFEKENPTLLPSPTYEHEQKLLNPRDNFEKLHSKLFNHGRILSLNHFDAKIKSEVLESINLISVDDNLESFKKAIRGGGMGRILAHGGAKLFLEKYLQLSNKNKKYFNQMLIPIRSELHLTDSESRGNFSKFIEAIEENLNSSNEKLISTEHLRGLHEIFSEEYKNSIPNDNK